jgi:EAL domain-containing protein (putative c-di-GMP-specific phosphodiesterase class I)
MYAAKAAGRNRYCIYEPALDSRRNEHRAIARQLKSHIENGKIALVFQPIVDARTRTVRGVEALARWPAEDEHSYPPAVFVPVAEEFGLIEELGAFVLREACRQAARWPGIFVSVNISPLHFLKPGFVESVESIVAQSGLRPNQLEIEVTESLIMGNAERAEATIGKLHGMRVGVSLDDFGTGYSSIGHLKRFRFDKLKLDRSMVADILRSPSALRLIQGAVTMADSLGLTVVAEGVDDESQVAVLKLAGCGQFQGFLFSEPVDGKLIPALIEKGPLRAAG